jgi:hypothetical protein
MMYTLPVHLTRDIYKVSALKVLHAVKETTARQLAKSEKRTNSASMFV